MVLRPRRARPCTPRPGLPERASRQTLQGRSVGRHGMEAPPGSDQGPLGQMGLAPCGSVCNVRKRPITGVRFASSRSTSPRGGCSSHGLEQPLGLRLSAGADPPESTAQGEIPQLRTHSDSPLVASERVERGSTRVKRRAPSQASNLVISARSTPVESVPSEPSGAEPSRLEVIARHVRGQGFSDAVAGRIARGGLRKSSLTVYTSRWNQFSRWCTQQERDPWKADVPLIADFLVHQWYAIGQTSRTVEGYRTAISNTLALVLHKRVGDDPFLSALVASFYTDRPVARRTLPQWNLTLVLQMLERWPFECLEDPSKVDLKFWSWKTCFLVTLASGARRSEIHALASDRIQWSPDRSQVTLRPFLGFLAKNHVARDPSTAFTGFTLSALD